MSYYIAIDGGGTKTIGILADENENIISEIKAKATNPNDIGIETASGRLVKLVSELIESKPTDEPIKAVYAGIAGAGNHSEAMSAALKAAFPNLKLGIGCDAFNLLRAGIPFGDGACIISGTGSVCYVRSGDKLHRIGGWGWLLDNGGSGYDIGRDGLSAVLASHDGRRDATLISGIISKKLGGDPWNMLGEIYEKGKPFIAELSECVFEADEAGDMIAGEILARNAEALCEYLSTAHLILQKPFKTVLGGGAFENTESLLGLMNAKLRVMDIPTEPEVCRTPQVIGALRMAYELGASDNIV